MASMGAGVRATVIFPKSEPGPDSTSSPAEEPEQISRLSPDIGTLSTESRAGAWARLRYEQRDLSRATSQLEADLLLVGRGGAPLRSSIPMVTIAALSTPRSTNGIPGTFTAAVGRAGSRGAITTLYPNDVPIPDSDQNTSSYQPFVSVEFENAVSSEEAGSYVLCHGFDRAEIPLILAAWTFVEGSLGDTFPLIFAGASAPLELEIRAIAAELEIEDSVRVQREVGYAELPRLYRRAAVFLAVSFSACGQAMRWALAAGVPVVGLKTPRSDSLLGEAGYVVPPGDSRRLGAACLTALIQEPVAQALRERGLRRARDYMNPQGFQGVLHQLRRAAGVEPSTSGRTSQ